MGEIVRKAFIGLKKMAPVQRVDRAEAWEEWVEEGADSKEVIRVMRSTCFL